MDGSIIAIIYGVILVLFFILLVTLTITLIVSKSKGKKDKEDDKYIDEEYDEYDLFSKDEKASKDWYDEDDSSEVESVFDSAFSNSVESYMPVSDTSTEIPTLESVISAQEHTESIPVPSEQPVVSVNQTQPSVQPEPIAPVVEQPVEAVSEPVIPVQKTEEPVSDSAFTDSAFTDSAFADNTITDSAFVDSAFADSVFDAPVVDNNVVNPSNIEESIKEAEALSAAIAQSKIAKETTARKPIRSNVSSTADFYWYNKMDVAEKPSYKTEDMYYHHFNIAKDCIEDLLVEMYDCALVRTEEIKYIAYGIEPRAVSMKEILTSGNRNYTTQARIKEPTTEDRVRIYEKWCGYVDKLFEKVYIHADSYTIEEIRAMLYEFGKSDVDVLIEGM